MKSLAKNIILHGLPPDVYALVNHQEAAKDIWDRVKLLMKGTELSYQEHECRLYNLFDKFASIQGETLYDYYWRFSQLINDMHTIEMTMQQVQVNTNQHGRHANEVRIMPERYPDPLALVTNSQTLYNPSQSPQHAGFHLQTINSERLPIPEIRQPFKMEESQFNKFKEDKLRVLLALETEELLQPQGETRQLEKLMLVKAQEVGHILDEEQLAFIADPGIVEVQVAQQTIPHNSAFQTEDLDVYDSDCDDISSAKAILMENLSSCDLNFLSKVPYSDTYLNDMINQDVQEMPYSEHTHIVDFSR
ncbi:hypothetical protein Tco_1127447 [Tanacetum coccineum]